MSKLTTLLAAAMLATTPSVGVKCSRDLVPGHDIEVFGPYGTTLRSGGGKTVIGADIPGISIRPR